MTSQIAPEILPHAIKQSLSAAYANKYNELAHSRGDPTIDTYEAWDMFAQHTWEVAFNARFPGGENLSFETAAEAFRADVEEWTE